MKLKQFIDYLYNKSIQFVFYFFLPFNLLVNILSIIPQISYAEELQVFYLLKTRIHIVSGLFVFCMLFLILYDFLLFSFIAKNKLAPQARRKPYLTMYLDSSWKKAVCSFWFCLLFLTSINGLLLAFYDSLRAEYFYFGDKITFKWFHSIGLWFLISTSLIYYYFVFSQVFSSLKRNLI